VRGEKVRLSFAIGRISFPASEKAHLPTDGLLFHPGALLDEVGQIVEYFVGIEQFATRSLGGAAF
jgi:hypothetical protein